MYEGSLINHHNWMSRNFGHLDSFLLLVGSTSSMLFSYYISSSSSCFDRIRTFSYFIIPQLQVIHSSYLQPQTTQRFTYQLQLPSPSPNLPQLIFLPLINYLCPSKCPKILCLPQLFCIYRNFPSSFATEQHLSPKSYPQYLGFYVSMLICWNKNGLSSTIRTLIHKGISFNNLPHNSYLKITSALEKD